jgi:hypothetical protein
VNVLGLTGPQKNGDAASEVEGDHPWSGTELLKTWERILPHQGGAGNSLDGILRRRRPSQVSIRIIASFEGVAISMFCPDRKSRENWETSARKTQNAGPFSNMRRSEIPPEISLIL